MDRFVKSFMGKSLVEINLKRLESFLNAERGFLLITAYTPDIVIDDEINLCRDLLADIKTKKLGYIPLRYKYVEENEIVYQHGFFISNSESGKDNFLIKAKSLCEKHTEEPALYVEKGKAYWLYPNGTETLLGDCVGTLEEIRSFWAKRIHDSDFIFDSFESLYPINSFGLNAAHNWGELFSRRHISFKVMSRSKAKKYSYSNILEPTIIISITDIGSSLVTFNKNQNIKDILNLQFDDVNYGEECCITENVARKILNFVDSNLLRTACILVQCEAGISRSAGICAALMLILKEDDTMIFDDEYYSPNLYVYRTILNTYFNQETTYKNIDEYRKNELPQTN